jgi:hypothetical protein
VHDDLVRKVSTADGPNRLWLTDIERHEALTNRAVVKGHRLQPVAAGWSKLRAAVRREVAVRREALSLPGGVKGPTVGLSQQVG